MPDWSYRTLIRPALFALPPERAHERTLRAVAAFARLPRGSAFIELFGDETPPPALATTIAGVPLRSRVGLAPETDATGGAARGLAGLGVGFVEIGPVTEQPVVMPCAPVRDVPHTALLLPDAPVNPGLAAFAAALRRARPVRVPLVVRLAHAPGAPPSEAAAEQRRLAALAPSAALFTLDWTHALGAGAGAWDAGAWEEYLAHLALHDGAAWGNRPVLAAVPPDADPATLASLLPRAVAAGVRGVTVAEGVRCPDGRRAIGPSATPAAVATVRAVRAAVGAGVSVVAAGGVTEPADALALVEVGADAVQVSSGLVFSGPALPRRVGETLLAARAVPDAPVVGFPDRWWRTDWPWVALLGAGMIFAGLLAWIVAAVWVVLPYDEAYLGLTRAQLAAANARLLPFMAHDRVSLAGTMVSLGIIYTGLALGPVRGGSPWGRRAFLASASVGFASFGLVLGHRYMDPLHALASLILLPFLWLAWRGARPSPATPAADLRNDPAWLRAQWGQLALVALGLGFVFGGAAISTVGVTGVFVREDLAYMATTADALNAANPRLLAVVAHDRAGFGGALASDGVAFLLAALWGIRRGARGVWWTLLLAGLPGFVGGGGVHFAVGYTNALHIAPAAVAFALWAVGLALTGPYCQSIGAATPQAWGSAARAPVRATDPTA